MTIQAFQALYCSSVAFGMRKALQAEQGKCDLQKDIDDLNQDKEDLKQLHYDLKQKFEQSERRAAELRLAAEKKHAEQISVLKKSNQQLKSQLEGIIAAKNS